MSDTKPRRPDWVVSTDGGRVVASVGDYYLAQDIAIQLRNENPDKCFVVGKRKEPA